jgi:hypothetical protein
VIEKQLEAGDNLQTLLMDQLENIDQYNPNWRSIADSAGINPLKSLPIGDIVKIPELDQLTQQAESLLGGVSAGLNQAKGQITEVFNQVAQYLPPGYAAEAQKLLGEVNGVFGQVESIVGQGTAAIGKARDYKGEVAKLVDWLL